MVRCRWAAPLVVAVALVLASCSGSSAPPRSDDLVKDLAILKTQQQFTDAQVRCVATYATAHLHGGDLRRFGKDIAGLNATGTTDGMAPLSLRTFTGAVAACATGGT